MSMNNAEHRIRALAQGQHGAVSRQQALEAGLSAGAIKRRLIAGEWVQVFRGAYRIAGTEPTWEQTVMAGFLAAGPGAVASHRAAATLHGMLGVPRWVEVTVARPREVAVKGIIAHRTRLLLPEDAGAVKGIPVTTAGRTIADLSRIYPAARVAPLLDHALAGRLVTRADLEARATGRSHNAVLQGLLAERPASARPMGSDFEVCLFRALEAAGLPPPVPQYRVMMPDGSVVFLDFAYPDVKLAIEADSYIWHASLSQWQHDRARNSELVTLGWSILMLTHDLVMHAPGAVARMVGDGLRARGSWAS